MGPGPWPVLLDARTAIGMLQGTLVFLVPIDRSEHGNGQHPFGAATINCVSTAPDESVVSLAAFALNMPFKAGNVSFLSVPITITIHYT